MMKLSLVLCSSLFLPGISARLEANEELVSLVRPCTVFSWPKRLKKLIWAEPEEEAIQNAAQFCQEQGYDGVGDYQINFPCDDNDEDTFADYNGQVWVDKDTPSANRCYRMFKSISCCNGCTTFNSPKRNGKLIWAEPEEDGIENVARFCHEMGFAGGGPGSKIDFPCEDNDEMSFSDWNGINAWVGKATPSANRCYKMWKSIQCCPNCATFFRPKRLGELIWAEPSLAGYSNIIQFCKEQGFASVVASSIEYPCDDNDEDTFANYNGADWVHKNSPSANRCYKMWESVKCCEKSFKFPIRPLDPIIEPLDPIIEPLDPIKTLVPVHGPFIEHIP